MRRTFLIWTMSLASGLGITGCSHRWGSQASRSSPVAHAAAPAAAAPAAAASESVPAAETPAESAPATRGFVSDAPEAAPMLPPRLPEASPTAPPTLPALPPFRYDPPSLQPPTTLPNLQSKFAPKVDPEVIVISALPRPTPSETAPTAAPTMEPPAPQPTPAPIVTQTPAPVVTPTLPTSSPTKTPTGSWTKAEPVQTLTGEVQQFRRAWRLRYAPIDAEDAHGGSVSLVGDGLDQLQDGQRVRVSGVLRPSEDRAISPRFNVLSVEVIAP